MAIYYAIVDGDPLTSGPNSRVYAPSTSCFIDGDDGRQRNMAYIGDKAYCEKCDSTGIIIGGARVDNEQRMIDLESGRRQAVGGDYVLCKCPERPQVIARYGRNWIIEDDGGATPSRIVGNAAGAVSPASQKPETPRHVRWFYVRDSATGEPLRNRNYVADIGGARQSGKTDGDGYAQIETDSEQSVEIHTMFSSPTRTLKPFQGV